ncbi:hypothetical protein niasHT_012590 [Heterodera trifolii]|uniref:Uncharacterized protein n=1 Tax=Heterodera trifolii TaxID=157864 RepID=A0ABD2L1E5_9BILA
MKILIRGGLFFIMIAFTVASLLVIGFLFSLWLGGFAIRVVAVVIEDSEEGYHGIETAEHRAPIKANFTVDGLNTVVLALIIFFAILFVIQLCLFGCLALFLPSKSAPISDSVDPWTAAHVATDREKMTTTTMCQNNGIQTHILIPIEDQKFVYF